MKTETGRRLTELEITPEMIEAGVAYAIDSMAFVEPVASGEALREFVATLYSVMTSGGKAPTLHSGVS